jgi:L-lactate dehydrogenase complex protein LldG
MRSSGRVEFIETIRKALDRSDSDQRSLADMIQKAPDADDVRLLEAIAGRDKASHLALLDRLIDAGKRVNVGVLTAKDVAVAAASVSRIAAEKTAEWGDRKVVVAWDHPFVKKLALETVFKPLGIPVYFPYTDRRAADRKEDFRRHAEKAFIGITSADYCIAETATLTMKTRPGQPRCVSLLPSMHIAIIRLEQILTNLKELYTLLRWNPTERVEGLTRCMTYITGPSKTADIEATLVHGAHGPRELSIIVLTG